MSKVDIRLLYQKESGHGIETINRIAGQSTAYGLCPECDLDVHCELDPEITEYINFLETMLESSLSVGNMLLEEWARTTTE